MILFVFFHYAFVIFLILCGMALMLMLFVMKWVIAVTVAIIMCLVDVMRGKPLSIHIDPPKTQAYYSNRR